MTFPIRDSIFLAGKVSPGAVRVRKASDPRKWEVRAGYGITGASTVYTGDDLKPFACEFSIWLPEQIEEWADFAKVLVKPTQKTRYKALGIYHPLLRVPPLNISAVTVLDVSQWDVDDHGLWTCTVDFQPFRAPKPMLSRPSAAVPGVAKAAPTAQDAADVKMGALLAQVNDLL